MEDPTVVKTVSNTIVSIEKRRRAEESVVIGSFLQPVCMEKIIAMEIIKNEIWRIGANIVSSRLLVGGSRFSGVIRWKCKNIVFHIFLLGLI